MCSSWHPTQQNMDGPILDLWQRDYVSMHFQKVKQHEAYALVFCIRVPASVYKVLLTMSGNQGVYFEPRTPDGKAQDPRFQTVWLQRQSITDAKATQAVIGETSSLARVNTKYGIKVPADRAPHIHAKLRPDEPFFAGGAKQLFKVGPMPWGSTKRHLQAMFDQWGWKAKPAQPAGKSADATGLMWTVVAIADPPAMVYTMKHGDVVILREEPHTKNAWKPPQPQASQSTINQHRAAKDVSGDPWADPWADAARKLPRQQHEAAVSMAAIESTIEQKVAEQVRAVQEEADVPMGNTIEPRIQQMEQQIAQLQASQANMTTQAATFETKLDYLNAQVENQSKCFAQTLDTQLAAQMERIEALMNKRKLGE